MEHSRENIVSHLEALVRAVTDDPKVKQSFLDLADDRSFTTPQLKVLFRSASVTAKTDLNGTYAALWPIFRDNLVKKTMGTHNLPDEQLQENLMDLVIFTRWNKENFTWLIGAAKPSGGLPDYPAAMEKIDTFPVFLHYMADKVSPVIQTYLRVSMGMNESALENALGARENALIASGVRGVEILTPIPPEKWPRPKKAPDRSPP